MKGIGIQKQNIDGSSSKNDNEITKMHSKVVFTYEIERVIATKENLFSYQTSDIKLGHEAATFLSFMFVDCKATPKFMTF